MTMTLQNSKPSIGRWIDSFGTYYARAVIGGVLLSFGGLLLTGVPLMSQGPQRGALYRSIGLLSTASPCALVLVPLAYVSALAAISNRFSPTTCSMEYLEYVRTFGILREARFRRKYLGSYINSNFGLTYLVSGICVAGMVC